jgi:hypothetical protein
MGSFVPFGDRTGTGPHVSRVTVVDAQTDCEQLLTVGSVVARMVDSTRAVSMSGDEQRVHLLEKLEAHRRRELHDA